MKDISPNKLSEFTKDLRKICESHGLYPSGTFRLRYGKDWDNKTFSIKSHDSINYGYATDNSGPFISFSIEPVYIVQKFTVNKSKVTIADRDHLLRDGVKSQADGKIYGNRRDYNDHLKRHGMEEVGDQAPTKASSEIRGDFDCRKELHEAIKQHMG